MLERLFSSFLSMSTTASYVIIAVILARFLLKKAPKIFSFALWAVVLFRLLCPFTFESSVGIIPEDSGSVTRVPQISTDFIIESNPTTQYQYETPREVAAEPERPLAESFLPYIWTMGIVIMLIISIVQYAKLQKNLIGATPLKENIYVADHISSPFVMGIIKPKIFLPSSLSDREKEYIIAHEKHHIKRFDHITRILAFVALALHWYNPLVWLAFVLSGKDMEMSCDEAVMKNMHGDIRAEYSTSLLRLATGSKIMFATPLAFGEGDPKGRVKNIMSYKEPLVWVSVLAVIVVVVLSVGFMSSRAENKAIPMSSNALSDLAPVELTQSIADFYDLDFSELNIFYDADISVSPNFEFVKDESIGFFHNFYSKIELGFSLENSQITISEPVEWQNTGEPTFKLLYYFEALKYLPQDEIFALCKTPPDRYTISISDYEKANLGREIYYNKNGVTNSVNYHVRLDIQPLYSGGGSDYTGVGSDIIHVYYSTHDKESLTLDDIIKLSEKGQDLSWADFDDFVYEEGGLGSYIRLYHINDVFTFVIGGGLTDDPPIYMYLVYKNDSDNPIDIRYENVEEFVNSLAITKKYTPVYSDDLIELGNESTLPVPSEVSVLADADNNFETITFSYPVEMRDENESTPSIDENGNTVLYIGHMKRVYTDVYSVETVMAQTSWVLDKENDVFNNDIFGIADFLVVFNGEKMYLVSEEYPIDDIENYRSDNHFTIVQD